MAYGQQRGVSEDLTRDALRLEKLVEKLTQIHLQVRETLRKSREQYKSKHDQHIHLCIGVVPITLSSELKMLVRWIQYFSSFHSIVLFLLGKRSSSTYMTLINS